MPENFTTLPHFSASAARNLLKSAGEPENGTLPTLVSRLMTSGSASTAFISLLRRSTMASGVPLGTPRPSQPVTT